MDDEFILKRKLTFDGDGCGDEGRIHLMLKMIAEWTSSNCPDPDFNNNMFNSICAQLAAVEHSRRKSEQVKQTYERDARMYHQLREEMEKNIQAINESIKTSKTILEKLKNFRQQKLNYDIISRAIAEVPTRAESSNIINKAYSALMKLKEAEDKLNVKLNIWRKHCSVILLTAEEMISNYDLNKNKT